MTRLDGYRHLLDLSREGHALLLDEDMDAFLAVLDRRQEVIDRLEQEPDREGAAASSGLTPAELTEMRDVLNEIMVLDGTVERLLIKQREKVGAILADLRKEKLGNSGYARALAPSSNESLFIDRQD